MRAGRRLPRCLALVLLMTGCGNDATEPPATPAPTSGSARPAEVELTTDEVGLYLRVRELALERLDRELAAAERRGASAPAAIEELTSAERRAADLAGADWKHYTAIRDEIGHVLALQRRREDARVLGLELRRAREDLQAQLGAARDPASRQFLQAQIDRLSGQIDKLEREREPTPSDLRHAQLLDSFRVSIATQQGRLERIQKRARELLRDSGSASPRLTEGGRGKVN